MIKFASVYGSLKCISWGNILGLLRHCCLVLKVISVRSFIAENTVFIVVYIVHSYKHISYNTMYIIIQFVYHCFKIKNKIHANLIEMYFTVLMSIFYKNKIIFFWGGGIVKIFIWFSKCYKLKFYALIWYFLIFGIAFNI